MALKWLKTVKKSSSRLFKWSLKLSQYNFDIKYNPGKNHIEADTLSRSPISDLSDNSEYIRICNLVDNSEIADAQRDILPIKQMH